jgi:hypothetical protein
MPIRSRKKGKRRLERDGSSWSASDLRGLKALAKSGISATQTAKHLGRTPAAVQQKAMRSGISFRRGRMRSARK